MAVLERKVSVGFVRVVLAIHGVIAVTAEIGCQESLPPPEQPIVKPAAAQSPPPQPKKRAQQALDASAVRSRLVVKKAGKANDARQVVILARPRGVQDIPERGPNIRLDMMPREMVRQAMLVAARDELGLPTRDEVIDETLVDSQEATGGIVEVVSFVRDKVSHELIRRVENDASEILVAHETPTAPGTEIDLLKLLASAEELSRNEFPGVLKKLGLAGKPNAVKAEAGLPAKVDDRLTSLEFLDALLAVRDVHKTIQDDGESPVRLGALARGYALMGVLSEFQWHPAHRAFKARALVYSQRLAARDPKRPFSLWNRAFALALFGRHRDAIADLDEAKKYMSLNGLSPKPDWVDVVDAYCRYDSARLARTEGPQRKLAQLLRMFTLAFPRTTAAGLHAADEVVNLEPYCFRAHDAMSDFSGVATQHATTMIAPQALEHFLSKKLSGVEELPSSVKDHLAGDGALVEVTKRLDKAGTPETDTGEPAWGVLAHLLRETRFVQIFRRLYFMRFMLAVPTDDVWNEARSDVAGHRYGPYLESLVPGPDLIGKAQKFADTVDLIDLETTESAMCQMLWNLQGPRAKSVWEFARGHEDETAEMALSLWQARDENRLVLARDVLKASPYHPFARAILIDKAWDSVKDQVPAWEKDGGDSPALLAALGLHYSAAKNFDDAQRLFSRYIELSPDAWAFQALAANFKAQGRIDRWQSTLEDFLKVEDLGLDHAKVQIEIANHYMGLKEWGKAQPYAEAAAQTGAGWAMECAARCAEGQKDWELAEAWFSRSSQRYPDDSWGLWYFFCKRTGQGNLAAAREFANQYVTSRADRPDVFSPEYAGCFYWLDGRTKEAKAKFDEAYEKYASVSSALCRALIADDENDASRRDALLKEITTKHEARAPKTAAICRLLAETVFDPSGKKPLDMASLDRLIESVPEDGRGNSSFFAGCFLQNHGDAKNADRYLEQCSQSPRSIIWYRYIADERLKRFRGG